MFFGIQHTPHVWQFKGESDKACLSYKNGCYWPRGKMLGGSHGINAMIYLRGNERDYDEWERLGNPTWGWNDVLKYFKKSESNQNPELVKRENGKYHNSDGMLIVDSYHDIEEIKQIYLSAANELGYKFVDDFNSGNLVGYAFVQGTVQKGRRQSVAKTFLIPAKERPNLHIIKHAHVKKVVINDEGMATGVEFTYNGTNEFTVHSKKEVVLSGGSISSPQLLLLSGVGPESHLKAHGIAVKKDLPVGHNLQDHLIVPVFYQFHESTAQAPTLEEILDIIYMYAIHKSGPLASVGAIDLVGFINTVNHTGFPDIELHHFTFKINSPELQMYLSTVGFSTAIQSAIAEQNKVSEMGLVYVVLLNPKSIGKIELASSNPYDKPKIQTNYLGNRGDLDTLLRGFKYQISFSNTNAFQEHEGKVFRLPLPPCDDFEYQSEAYLECYIGQLSTTVYHPVGTAKMGPTGDAEAVVDSRLRVQGIQNLRVIDASIMPLIVSSNTNAPTIMIGEKGADFIKEDWMSKDEKDEL